MALAAARPRRRGAHLRRSDQRLALAAVSYAAIGWPVCAGAHPTADSRAGARPGIGAAGRACSCDRVGCPAPGAHPVSPAWQLEATADLAAVALRWAATPSAGIILATGRGFDVLDVPATAGRAALARMDRSGVRPGPVALSAQDRALFFVAPRAAFADPDELWSCHLDCVPERVPEVTGLRWHCADSYVLAPPSRLASGLAARWITAPGERPLPDALRLLEYLADACEERAR